MDMLNKKQLHEHRSYGILCVYKSEEKEFEFLIVKHSGGDHWAFPKGSPEEGEQPLETAIRELEEETNISEDNVDIKEDVTFTEEYNYVTSDKKDMHKINTFYLGFVKDKDRIKINTPTEDELLDIGWFSYEKAKERLTHKEARELLEKVSVYLNKD